MLLVLREQWLRVFKIMGTAVRRYRNGQHEMVQRNLQRIDYARTNLTGRPANAGA